MRALGIILLSMAVIVVNLSGVGSAQEKKPTNKEKIIGTWKQVKPAADKDEATMEFTKDAKFTLTLKGKVKGKLEGKYELDGDSLKLTLMGVETHKIKVLTEKDMVWEDKVDDKTVTSEFKRVK